jgi:MFS family permease
VSSVAATAAREAAADGVDSRYAWWRLLASLLLSTIGGVGMWSVVVTLPTVQAEFGVARAEAALPYTAAMLGVMLGGILMGRVADRFGVLVPVVIGTLSLGLGYVASSFAGTLWQFALAYALPIGAIGTAACFGPLIADVSHWFRRHRGMAVAIASSGSYLAGTVWPPILQHCIDQVGWRQTHVGIGLFCVATMLPLALAVRRRAPHLDVEPAGTGGSTAELGVAPGALQALLVIAGIACCVAMSMPQVHIVAYCTGLGYSAARGAELLSVMFATGVVSRLASGWIADRIGGPATLLLGSVLQALALLLYMPFDGLASLYVISALFGLSQGGIVPSYTVVIRRYFPAQEAGQRVGLVLAATLAGMALGGWISGAIFDLTGSYQAAFANGLTWNLLHIAIAWWLYNRARGGATAQPRNSITAAE